MTAPTVPAWGYGLLPPPTEALAKAYWTPLMAPIPVTTRLPKPGAFQDMVDPFLRIEAGGGFLRNDEFVYDVSIILHGYAPQNLETQAEQNLNAALAWGARAYNSMISDGTRQWWVMDSRITATEFRQNDPLVNMTRYKGMVTWLIPGQSITPGVS